MRDLLKFRYKYFIFISLFGLAIHLIYLMVPIYMMVICDRVLYSFSGATLVTLSLLTLFCLTVMGVLEYMRSKMAMRVGFAMEQRVLPHVLATIHNNAAAADNNGYDRGVIDLACVREAVVHGVFSKGLDLPWIVLYLVILYVMNPLLGGVATIGLGMTFMFQQLLGQLNTKRYIASHGADIEAARLLSATTRHADLIAGMGMLEAVQGKYHEVAQSSRINRYQAANNRCATAAVRMILQGLSIAAIFGSGTYLFFSQQISIGIVFAGVIIMARLFYPLDVGFESLKSVAEAFAAYERLLHFVETRERQSTLTLPRPKGALNVESVTMVVKGKTLLKNISFHMEPGETLGLLGPSGAGKTVLLRLILGVWNPAAGKIRLDGGDLSQWKREDLGIHVGYLPQETELFAGSIAENISRLKIVDSEKVIQAARKAHCHEMILSLTKGYDFMVDNTGKNLSIGQRRRIALARALYDDPQVVVLDDPHAGLDESGFKALMATLQLLKKEKKSVVLVAERPNMVAMTNKLLMLREGQVAMFGPTKEVLSKLSASRQQTSQQNRQQLKAVPSTGQNRLN
ncbi:ATP-binding cassette, subfamily C/ATP-binding cassette, subfamily C, exporter for protease/lipase [Desulfocicer vacuolatum DSM 3385]|uniref:ATP-binding cassette, subfamily C/ATP-binding cassette, subfamily C, exporter for protease/lipase n=1 Tax=Desulfocicer vacuolatum DSM 3385 TaxID=1121400 RepID=A0A1W2BTX4_9BACT|nr:ATP-binding cassette domain-containing protein [Desulfocicer vacuolatum]SMC76430.1 ATP-binding cassette, subfamily C/ATP-binding cassette, subfamily C, exporter for protease/lipase [Desulfocicer vacuolatum DSM 3385]